MTAAAKSDPQVTIPVAKIKKPLVSENHCYNRRVADHIGQYDICCYILNLGNI